MSPLAWVIVAVNAAFWLGYFTGHQLARGGPWLR